MEKKPETRVVVEEISDDNISKVAENEKEKAPEIAAPINESEEKIDVKAKKDEIPVENKTEIKTKKQFIKNRSSSNFNLFWIIFPGIMLLGLLMGGIIAYYSGLNKLKSSDTTIIKITPQPTTGVESLPSASPVAKVDLSKYKIKILNGSGIKGEAGKVQTLLEKAGFSIESTGNASKYDYANTVIQSKEGVDKAFLDELEKELSKTYKLDKNTVLKGSETSSVIVIVGTSKSN